jgi:hypothetical protein
MSEGVAGSMHKHAKPANRLIDALPACEAYNCATLLLLTVMYAHISRVWPCTAGGETRPLLTVRPVDLPSLPAMRQGTGLLPTDLVVVSRVPVGPP